MAKHGGTPGKGAPRRAGKRKGKIAAYYKLRYPFNKLKRILRYNGLKAAEIWANKHQEPGALIRAKTIVKESNWRRP